MKITVGKILTLLASVAALVGFGLYIGSGFSADYGPLLGVEILLIVLIISGIIIFILSSRSDMQILDIAAPLFCMLSMFALIFSFYTMVTPIGYVIANLNPFSEIARWVAATVCMGVSFLLHFISLFFPIIKR